MIINKLLEMYNINANNDKNEVAQKTAEFIDERIGIISKEVGSTVIRFLMSQTH